MILLNVANSKREWNFLGILLIKAATKMDLGPDIKIDYALPFVPFKNEEYQHLNILKKIVNHGIKETELALGQFPFSEKHKNLIFVIPFRC